jgi:hypothetical protein
MPLLSKEAARRIGDVVAAADGEYEDGEPVDGLLAKCARLQQLPPAHAGLVAQAWNIASQNSQRLMAKTASEKFAAFPIATEEGILSHLAPSSSHQKQAATEEGLVKAGVWDDLPRPAVNPHTTQQYLTKSAAFKDPKDPSPADFHRAVKSLPPLMPGYGHILFNPESKEAWVVSGDSDENDLVNRWCLAVADVPGVDEVRAEAEHWPKEAGWKKMLWGGQPGDGQAVVAEKSAALGNITQDLKPLERLVKEANHRRAQVVKAAESYRGAYRELVGFFHQKRAGIDRLPISDYERVAQDHYGQAAQLAPLFDLLHKDAQEKRPRTAEFCIKRAWALQPDAALSPFRELEEARRAMTDLVKAGQAMVAATQQALSEAELLAGRYGTPVEPTPEPPTIYSLFGEKQASLAPDTQPRLATVLNSTGSENMAIRSILRTQLGALAEKAGQALTPDAWTVPALGAKTPVLQAAFGLVGRSWQEPIVKEAAAAPEKTPCLLFHQIETEVGTVDGDLPENFRDLHTGLTQKQATLMGGMGFGAAAKAMGGVIDNAAPPRDVLVNNMLGSLNDPAMLAEERKIRAQTLLADLMHNDEVVSGQEPDRVLRAYNQLASFAPRGSLEPAVVGPYLRQMLTGHTQPYEIKELTGLEGQLRDRERPISAPPSLDSARTR